MNKEDIEKAVADLVEAMAVDMAILEAQSGMSSYGAMRADARRAYETATELYGNAEAQYLELQRHKRDVSALRELLSSLLAGGNISTEPQVSPADRLAYAIDVYNLMSVYGEGDAARKSAHDVLDGKCDATVRLWLEERASRVRSGT